MTDTKEKILITALHLFARDGYEAVSVSMISGELGMTKGALYKHFKNKRDIFDSIVDRMYTIDAERSLQYNVPCSLDTDESVSWEAIKQFTIAQYIFWTEDDFACSFRRMLALEQYRNAEIAQLYQDCVVAGPAEYMESIFARKIADGSLNGTDPKLLALDYYSPMFLLIGISEHSESKKQNIELLKKHIDSFIYRNVERTV